jgi:hypothetical protein
MIRKINLMFRAKAVIVLLLSASGLVPVLAQVSTGEIGGTVADASGAAVPNAKVTATNEQTNAVARETMTSADGTYIMTLLPPGTYAVAAEVSGFRKSVQSGIELQTNQRVRVDLQLQVGQVSETVEVAARAPLLESQSSSLGTVIGQQIIGELPLNGRNFVTLALLSPGVNGVGSSVSGTIMSGTRPDDRRPGTEIFSNGNRENSNNFLYDGVDNNDRLTLSIVLRPGVDAIREFKVQTNLYSADLGRNSGAVVDVVSKSGTNEIHGSAFEFLRNSAMDARNFFNAKGTPFPTFRYNQFGFSLGGPFVAPKYNGRNKTFWFVDYEGFRRDVQNFLTGTIPTLGIRNGDFSGEPNRIYDPLSTRPDPNRPAGNFVRDAFPNQQIPRDRWDPVTTKLLNAYPLPTTSAIVNNYRTNLAQKQNWNQGDVRFDHQFTANDNFFARWSIQHTETIAPYTFPAVQIPGVSKAIGVGNEDSFAGPAFNPTQHAVASYTKVLSPRLINDFRVGFNRFVLDYTAEGAENGGNLGNQLGVKNSNTHPLQSVFPIFSPSGYTGTGHSRSLPIFRRENTFQYMDNVTFTVGAHTLKFGANITRRQITEYQTNRGNGRFNFSPAFTDSRGAVAGASGNSMASFLLGYATLIEQDFTLAWTGQRGWEDGLYFADDWRINKKLTLNLGLRWEYYSPYVEVADRIANFDADTGIIKVANRDGVDRRAGVNRDFKNWAPRFGFAYQALSHTVIRGGFGLFYNPNGNGGALLRLFRHPPYGPIYSVSPGDNFVGSRVSDGFPNPPVVDLAAAKNPSGAVIGVFPNFRSAYAEQYNLTVEHEVAPWQVLFKAAYVGNLGRRLGTTIDLNQPTPSPIGTVTQRRPFFAINPNIAGINYAVSDGLGNYQAFQFTVEKRLSHGLALHSGYTWSHNIDTVANDFGGGAGTPQDIRCRRPCERGNSAFDIRHRLTIAGTYLLPIFAGKGLAHTALGGWRVNASVMKQSGLPFNPGLNSSANTNSAGGSRPDRTGSGVLPSDQRSLQRWFDASAFAQPPNGRFGNAARNPLYGPGRVNFDVSLFKDFAFNERAKLQFRTEVFNVFNTPQFGQPNGTIFNPGAGQITSTVGTPRQIQLALRLVF